MIRIFTSDQEIKQLPVNVFLLGNSGKLTKLRANSYNFIHCIYSMFFSGRTNRQLLRFALNDNENAREFCHFLS